MIRTIFLLSHLAKKVIFTWICLIARLTGILHLICLTIDHLSGILNTTDTNFLPPCCLVGWVGGVDGLRQIIMPLHGSILQAGTCQILS